MINGNLIKTNIEDAYRYVRNNDKRAQTSMKNFLKEGKKSPSVALMYETAAHKRTLNFYKRENSSFIKRMINILKMHFRLDDIRFSEGNKTLAYDFEDALNKLYPKTKNLRMKVLKKLVR